MRLRFVSLLMSCSCFILIGCKSTLDHNAIDNEIIKYESSCSSLALHETQNKKDIVLLKRVDPQYPVNAAKKNIQGYVKMEFDISESGKPININIVETSSGIIFNKSSIQALKKWRYNNTPQTCMALQLDYSITRTRYIMVSH
jgi:TonB family protein